MKQTITLFVVALLCCLLAGCRTQKVIEQHHHYEADTMAISAHIDSRFSSWHQQMDSTWNQRFTQFSSEFHNNSNQTETVNELITTTTDSLGRAIRTEQRTLSRAISNSQWSMVNQVSQEYEVRLQMAVDSVSAIYQQRYDSLATHVAQLDSLYSAQTPAAATTPWYKRLWARALWFLIGIGVAVAVMHFFFERRRR